MCQRVCAKSKECFAQQIREGWEGFESSGFRVWNDTQISYPSHELKKSQDSWKVLSCEFFPHSLLLALKRNFQPTWLGMWDTEFEWLIITPLKLRKLVFVRWHCMWLVSRAPLHNANAILVPEYQFLWQRSNFIAPCVVGPRTNLTISSS
jgi:hypothetical protein